MPKICKNCGSKFPVKKKIDGKRRNLQNRSYCLGCSPFGSHNTKKIHLEDGDRDDETVCELCGREFPSYDRNRGYRGGICNSCRTKIRRHRTKLAAIKLLGGSCESCGYEEHPSALEFHHPRDDKNVSIGSVANKSWDVVREEVRKCRLLCSNCHRIEHSTRDDPEFLEAVKDYDGRLLDFDLIVEPT